MTCTNVNKETEFVESRDVYRLIDLVILNKQHLVTLATKSSLELFKNELLTNNDLLSCILVAICAGLALFFRIENDSELGWFQRPVDELQSSVLVQLLIVIDRCLLHELLLL